MQLNPRKINDPIKKWAKELNTISPKKTYRWLTNTWKDAQHHSLSEKCKSKPQWSTISCWSEWLLSKGLQTINPGADEETRGPCYTAGGNANHANANVVQPLWRTVWRCLKKLEIELPYDPAIPLLGIHTEETRIERHVYPSVHHSTVYNSQDMEAT